MKLTPRDKSYKLLYNALVILILPSLMFHVTWVANLEKKVNIPDLYHIM